VNTILIVRCLVSEREDFLLDPASGGLRLARCGQQLGHPGIKARVCLKSLGKQAHFGNHAIRTFLEFLDSSQHPIDSPYFTTPN